MLRTNRNWTSEEEDALRRGVEKHGKGNWKSICQDSDFSSIVHGRDAADIKAKWRSMNPKTSGEGSRSDGEATALVPYAEGEALVCPLCHKGKLTFEPPPIRCTKCNARIKRNGIYFTKRGGDAQGYVCDACHDKAARGTFVAFEEKKNDEETEELWVKCDRCENSAHQICALYNGEKKDAYTCSDCLSNQGGEHKSLPQSVPLEAKHLLRTILSNHLEKRLSRSLEIDKKAWKRWSSTAPDKVKGRDKVKGFGEFVIRVVSSVEKMLDVNQQFLEIFEEENYPTKFPYKSKVILLFQKLGQVDVCLFAMYVQEFGSKCPLPNQRCVYLSSLDSTKYLQPKIKAASGEPYYTRVYHEILIGYLEYCKKRGFARCYIRASPPLKGDDCILYCLPKMEKVPEINNVRKWYLDMLDKAIGEDIVIGVSNLYDRFFVPGGGGGGGSGCGECKAKVTVARLPYFDSDYWPATAKELINQICQEEETVAGTSGQVDPSANVSKDKLFMDKLGKIICKKKEDYIVVDLQYFCGHCDLLITGIHWQCNMCKGFKLCAGCSDANEEEKSKDAHPSRHRERHFFRGVITTVARNTDDKDIVLEPELFQSRQAFLTFCERNHYRFDNLRRSQHSSMMILHHLDNQAAPTSVTKCSKCLVDIDIGQGWQCEFCPGYAVCDKCHYHPHQLHNSDSAQNQESEEIKDLLQTFVLDVLGHAAQCRLPNCQRENCSDVRDYFYHQSICKNGRLGSCLKCLWILDLSERHSQDCKESECHVPLCKQRREEATAVVSVETGTPQHGKMDTDVERHMSQCMQRLEEATPVVPVEIGTPQRGQIDTDVECHMSQCMQQTQDSRKRKEREL